MLMTEDPVHGEDAFRAMFNELLPSARSAASMWVDPSRIDDVVSAAMTRAWQRFAERPVDRTKAWLLAMVYNEARNVRKAESRRTRTLNELAMTRPKTTASLHQGNISIEELDHLRSVLEQLSAQDREILALSWWEEQSDDDIAEILGITKNNAAVRLSRARARFYRAMGTTDDTDGCVA